MCVCVLLLLLLLFVQLQDTVSSKSRKPIIKFVTVITKGAYSRFGSALFNLLQTFSQRMWSKWTKLLTSRLERTR